MRERGRAASGSRRIALSMTPAFLTGAVMSAGKKFSMRVILEDIHSAGTD